MLNYVKILVELFFYYIFVGNLKTYIMTISKVITKKNLQTIFDDNGLDSFSVDSSRLNYDVVGNVMVDDVLYNYMTPFNFMFDDILDNSK